MRILTVLLITFCCSVTSAFADICNRGNNRARIACLAKEVEALKMQISVPRDPFPKGAVIAWLKPTGATLPEGWSPCAGMNGRFLLGSDTAGGTGGNPVPPLKVARDGGRDGRGFEYDGNSHHGLGDVFLAPGKGPEDAFPPFFKVEFICRK